MKNFFNWKLNTPLEYFNFILLGLSGIVILFFYVKLIERGRTARGASKRVHKMLRRSRLPSSTVLSDIKLMIGDELLHFDHLILDIKGILAIKTLNWGTSVYGEASSEHWKLKDKKREETIPNPMLKLEQDQVKLLKMLNAKEIYGVPVTNIAIMSDPFDNPEIYLGKNPPAITYKEIKPYFKKRAALPDRVKNLDKLTEVIKAAALKQDQ